jgi:hypothetical protein
MCLDDLDKNNKKINKRLFGPDEGRLHRRLDLNFLPCTPVQKTAENRLLKDGECLADISTEKKRTNKLQEIKKYIGSPVLTMVYNTQR